MSLILSLQIKLRKEKRLSWIMRTLGSRHSISCLEASRCCLHLGQYLGKECAHYRYGKSLGSHSPAQSQGPPHVGLAEGMREVLSLTYEGQASTILQSAGIAPCWLMASLPSAQGRPAQHPGHQKKQRAGLGSSWDTPAAAWAHRLEPNLPPPSPRFLRGQDFGLGEEIEALLQGEVASPGCFAGRAWVLHALQLLGLHQHKFLEAFIVLPHQGKGAVICQLQGGVTCKGEHTSHTCPTRLGQATLLGLGAVLPILARYGDHAVLPGRERCPMARFTIPG